MRNNFFKLFLSLALLLGQLSFLHLSAQAAESQAIVAKFQDNNNATINAANYRLNVVVPTGGTALKTEWYLDGVLKSSQTGFAGNLAPDYKTPFYQYYWELTNVSAGTHRWRVKFYDASGNSTYAMTNDGKDELTVNVSWVDKTPPTGIFFTPGDGDIAPSYGYVNVRASAEDNIGVTKIEYYINGQLKYTINGDNGFNNYMWGTKDLPDGAYTLTGKVYDAAGNVGLAKACRTELFSQGTIRGCKALDKTETTIYVKNKQSSSDGQTSNPDTKNCSDKQVDLNKITTKIANRYNGQIELIDQITKKVQQFYAKSKISSKDFNKVVEVLNKSHDEATKSMVNLVQKSTFDCNLKLGPQIDALIDQVTKVRESVKPYRLSAYDLISTVEGAK